MKKDQKPLDGQISMFDKDYSASDVTPNSFRYWDAAYKLFKSYGEYVAKDKFWRNINDPSTSHIVGLQKAFQNNYHGNLRNVERSRREKYNIFLNNLGTFQTICIEFGVVSPDRRWIENIFNGDDIDSYQNRCQTRAKKPEKYPAVAITELPPRRKRI